MRFARPRAGRWLLIRRHRRTRDLAFYRCHAPKAVSLSALAASGHRRPPLGHRGEHPGQHEPGGPGPAPGPHLDLLAPVGPLAMLAAAVLAAAPEHRADPAPDGLIPLTRNEIATLFASLIIKPAAARAIGCAGQPGAAATNTGPRNATTSGKQPKAHENHHLRLD